MEIISHAKRKISRSTYHLCCILLIALLTPNVVFSNEAEERQKNVEGYVEYAENFLINLGKLKGKANEIARINKSLEKSFSLYLKNKIKHETYLKENSKLKSLIEQSGINNDDVFFFYLFDAKSVVNKINIKISSLKQDLNVIKGDMKTESIICRMYGKDGETLYRENINDKYEVERNEIDPHNYEEYWCSAFLPRDQDQLAIDLGYSTFLPLKKSLEGVEQSEVFQDYCNIGELDSARDKVDSIIALYKQTDNSLLSKYYNMTKEHCDKLANSVCANTYFIKNTVVTRYITAGCKFRDVVIEDLEKDIEAGYFSELNKLNHLGLINNAKACQDAYGRGLRWKFVSPVIDKDCKKRNRDIVN